MKIYFKKFLLLIVLFLNSTIFSDTIQTESIYKVNKEVVDSTIAVIINLKLDIDLYEALLIDIGMMRDQVLVILDQLKKNQKRFIQDENNLDDMIFDYRSSAISSNKLLNINLLSKENQVSILASIFFGIGSLLTQKSKMKKLLDDEQIAGVLFLLTAMGIEFSSLLVIEKITELVYKNCLHLKTADLDNYIYESTIYDIFNKLSEKMIDKKLCSTAISKVTDMALANMKNDIIVMRNKTNKNNKSTKKNK